MHCPVSVRTFTAMRLVDVEAIAGLSDEELRPVLPCLVRMALCVPIDAGDQWLQQKKFILMKLSTSERANAIVSLLSVDFHALDGDLRKEMQIRSRPPVVQADGSMETALMGQMSEGLIVEYERSSAIAKFRIVLSEFVAIQSYARSIMNPQPFPSSAPNGQRSSELLDNEVYLNEICDILVIAIVELPTSMSLVDVVETLLHTRRGSELICRIVANFPECFSEVCAALIANGEKQDEDMLISRSRMKTLRMLCLMNPDKALVVRSMAVDSCRMPGLAVLICIDYQRREDEESGNELVSFVSSILQGGEERIKLWFSQYLRMGQKKIEQNQPTTVTAMRRELLRSLIRMQSILSSSSLTDSHMMETGALLRLYCALRSMPGMNMKFSDEETDAILSLITSMPPVTPSGVKLVSLFLCVFISCPSLITGPNAEKRAIAWLQNLVQQETYFGHVRQVKSSFEEMLLLIAIHFHSGQFAAISDLVCSFLGMKLQIRSSNLNRLRVIFTQDIFPEEKITSHAVKVPVTSGLSANMTGFLPVHCIYQLLKSRAFSKHRVPIREWILKQICQSKAPVHPILPLMIEAFVSSVITPSAKTLLSATNEPISESDLHSIFRHQIFSGEEKSVTLGQDSVSDLLTTQLLLLYYLLLFRDMWLSQCKQQPVFKVNKYSADLLSRVPVFYLVQEARKDQANYGCLFPPLLRLTTAHESHLCLVSDWLNSSREDWIVGPVVPAASIHAMTMTLTSEMPLLPASSKQVIQTLDRILEMPHKSLWRVAPAFISNLPALLNDDVPKNVLEKSKKLWWRLNSIFPDNLWIASINSLRPTESLTPSVSQIGLKEVNRQLVWNDVVVDPLHVLRCDQRVFRCPELMEMTLHMLSAFLAASRTMFNSHLMEKVSKSPEEEKDREELKVALIATQESAAIQILLESCTPSPEEADAGLLQPLREVQGLICTHLHQIFISDPNLAKLIHFQTYSSELLPLTVSAIPSMHICLDFVPELLSQPDLSKCVFAIELCSYLSLQYSTTKCLCAAKLCFNVSGTLLSLLPSEKRSSFFMPVLPALVRMCTAFPPLRDDAISLLKQLRQVSTSKLAASACTFISPKSLTRAYSLARLKYPQTSHFFRFCASLPDDEALYLIIHESMQRLDQSPGVQKIVTPL